jgi:sugar phosphate isomerase/epimerase
MLTDAQLDALERSSVTCIEIIGLPQDAIARTHLRDRLKRARFGLHSVHLPFGRQLDISQTDEAARAIAVEAAAGNLRLASSLGATLAVIHPGAEPIADGERAWRLDASRRSLSDLTQTAARFGMRLAVECLPRSCLGNTAQELADLLSALDPAVAGACIDVNHLNLREPDIAAAVARLAPRLFTLHCSDNDGLDERHWLPGSPDGVIDWIAFLGALREAGYAGPFMYEVRTFSGDPAEALRRIETNYHEFIIPAIREVPLAPIS